MSMKLSLKRHLCATRGFTLIELLVVIAIIAILAAILFPVFAKAREKARQITCASNLKQISLGILQYYQDSDEQFPALNANPKNDPNAQYVGWADEIQPYVKSIAILHCPDDPRAQNSNPKAEPYSGTYGNTVYTSYFYNTQIGTVGNGYAFDQGGIKLSQMPYPSLTIISGDNQGYNAANGLPYNGGLYCNFRILDTVKGGNNCGYSHNDVGTLDQVASSRHTDGANYSFADGHAKFTRAAAIWGASSTFTSGVIHAGTQDYPGLGISGNDPTFNAINE